MGKILTTSASTPVVVDTQYGALSTNFYVVPVSDQLLDQWYDEQKGEYKPDRTTSPLVLQAILNISDPDGVLPSQTSTFASILWEEIVEYKDNSGTTNVVNNGDVTEIEDTVIVGETAVRVYTVQADGKLVCRRNVEPTKSYRLKCTVTYNDTRSGKTLKFEGSVLLTTSKTAEENYILQLDTPRTQTFRPLMGDGTITNLTFGGTLIFGGTEVATAKYFWYWTDSDHPDGVLFGDANTPCAAYVSGQGTKLLTLNPDATEGLTVMLRVSATATAATPDLPIREYFSLMIIYDEVNGRTTSPNGNSLRTEHKEMSFNEILWVKGVDMDANVRAEYIRLIWTYHKNTTSSLTIAGYGDSCVIQRANLVTPSGQTVIVNPQIQILGPMDLLYDDNDELITDDSGSSTASTFSGYVVGRT